MSFNRWKLISDRFMKVIWLFFRIIIYLFFGKIKTCWSYEVSFILYTCEIQRNYICKSWEIKSSLRDMPTLVLLANCLRQLMWVVYFTQNECQQSDEKCILPFFTISLFFFFYDADNWWELCIKKVSKEIVFWKSDKNFSKVRDVKML